MSTYPRDEFDDIPETPRRQGVHRTRVTSATGRRGAFAWVLLAAAVVVVLVAAALFLVPKLLRPTSSPAPAGTSHTTASSTPKASPTTTPSPSSAPSTSASPTATSPSTPTPTAAAADRTLPVGVYNATTTSGLGNKVATTARSAGWTVAAVGNWSGTPVNTSVVFYRDPTQKASADALASDLGIATVLQAQQLGYPLAAVIGPGYTG
ncbi:LytR C-terminal domain-containing protein [Sinomonas terrae]|uniref:LytR C-terminal domain-containing protein n=1 Tax=Sinomonas terrae TaxID=2908838 RepID=A0ABS9U433_9MICC|nr:LytR C-terminal domain-containing protein [Sinomonas terrae]MCH6471453.1 LytR C-terminal domain-containing protein [Sinomonas terrae]